MARSARPQGVYDLFPDGAAHQSGGCGGIVSPVRFPPRIAEHLARAAKTKSSGPGGDRLLEFATVRPAAIASFQGIVGHLPRRPQNDARHAEDFARFDAARAEKSASGPAVASVLARKKPGGRPQ